MSLYEIFIKPYFDYKGWTVVGAECNSCAAATIAFVFIIGSIRSKFKDVVHIMPAKCMKAEHLIHELIKRVILGLEDIGSTACCVITDNNAINGKALIIFCQPP